jgi:plastocyanin
MSKFALALVLAVALFLPGCGGGEAKETRDRGNDASTGRIHGVVRLQGEPPARATEAITQDQQVCGKDVSLPRLTLGKNNGVQNVFVYLDDAPVGPPAPPAQPILVDQKNCQYVPHLLIVPVGSKIEITNSDPILHNVHGNQPTDDGPQTLFNIAQPVRGQKTMVDTPFTKPGIISLSCEAGHPWMSGYVFVANHPYVVTTNAAGEFVIPNVPPGTYHIKMWHEGVTLKQNNKRMQHYEYEAPYETTQEVAVTVGADAAVNFDLTLRPAN